MLARIKNLARLMVEKKKAGEKFVLMLGAGASLSSGVKTTATLMAELVNQHGAGMEGTNEERFDELWRGASSEHRRLFLEPYLAQSPAKGYQRLTTLIEQGYIDHIVTFNFDNLLEKALQQAGFTDFKVIIRGETQDEVFGKLAIAEKPRVKIFKLHGSLYSSDDFLFSKEEMLNYPPVIHSFLNQLTSRDMIICGYAFSDVCVVRAFSELREGGSIYYVNPSSPPDNLKGFLYARRSQDKAVTGPDGRFDDFFETLHAQVVQGERPCEVVAFKTNTFKFLDYYRESDKDWFLGRDALVKDILNKIEAKTVRAFHVLGPPKVGKTSLVCAGLLAHLSQEGYQSIYLRCEADFEGQLRTEIRGRLGVADPASSWKDLMQKLVDRTDRHTVIVLDQCEKAFQTLQAESHSYGPFLDFMLTLFAASNDRVTLVFVTPNDPRYVVKLAQMRVEEAFREIIEMLPLSPAELSRIIAELAERGGHNFDPRIVSSLTEKYQSGSRNGSEPGSLFTLTHVQAVCYYLARNNISEWESYFQIISQQGIIPILDALIHESNLMNRINDLPSAEKRMVIRAIMKLICAPNTSILKVVEFFKDHFPDVLGIEQFPEPIVFKAAAKGA